MIVLLDMDGPLAAFDRHFWLEASAQGLTFDIEGPEHQRHRFLSDHLPDHEARAFRRAVVDQAGWFRSLPPVERAQAGVTELLMADLEVWVCTKPLEVNPTCRDEKAAWLDEHFPMLGSRRLVVIPDKSLMVGDVLLDDAPKLDWLGRALWRPVIFDAPYNRAGSAWAGLPHWSWGDSVRDLVGIRR